MCQKAEMYSAAAALLLSLDPAVHDSSLAIRHLVHFLLLFQYSEESLGQLPIS